MGKTSRRTLLAAGLSAWAAPVGADASQDQPGRPLQPWRPGRLDIHHLSTGRGDATLIVGPDGSTLLIDAGAAARITAGVLPARPNSEHTPGFWIGRYVRRRLAETGRRRLDVVLASHVHADHVGGLADLAALVPIDRLLDPDFPQLPERRMEDPPTAAAYQAFIAGRLGRGEAVERFTPGRSWRLGSSAVEVRNLAARGEVWTGRGENTVVGFPREGVPGASVENAGSAAVRLRWGRFSYFHGGDLTDWGDGGADPRLDVLTPAAEACGPVDVAVAPHHGLHDASGPTFVRALAPRIWVVSVWHASHAGAATLDRFLNARLYPGPREVYVTALSPAMDTVAGRLTERLASRSGHVIVRVEPGGAAYRVVVTTDADESDGVLAAGGLLKSASPGSIL